MPSNFFGKLKPNQLMAMLQQDPSPYGLPTGQMRGQQPSPQGPMPQQSIPKVPQQPSSPGAAMQHGYFQGTDAKPPAIPDLPLPDLMPPMRLDLSGPPKDLKAVRPIGDSELEHEDDTNTPWRSDLDKYIDNQFAAGPGANGGPSFGTVFEDLGKEAQARTKQQQDFRQQFEGTPELDQLISKAQADLAQAKGERKKPGLGEFLTLALMNLGNRDHRNNADLVLGTGEQREKEGRLESLLTQLEGGRANAKMGGRRQMQAFTQSERNNALERQLKNAETQRKQKNEDRDYAQRERAQKNSVLGRFAGQEAQIQGASMDEKTRKAAAESRAQLKKALNLDDASLKKFLDQQRMMQQQQEDEEARKADGRQSRLFGDFAPGGGYA